MIAPNTRNPKVYSYIRFSTPDQSLGDSERRQLELAMATAKRKGLPFDESTRMTDRGMSGFHGDHRKKGALGQFLELVERGEIAPGSVLMVENLDRLGRESVVDAIGKVAFALIEHDITIETLSPPASYSRETVNSYAIYELVGQIKRAHDESQRKSDYGQANWKQKRALACADRKILTKRAPAWLIVKDGKFEAIPAAVETIRLIFDLKLRGLGRRAIEKKLNAGAAWVPAKSPKRKTEGWRHSYIAKILSNRAVIGECQLYTGRLGSRKPVGDPVAAYFPTIVEPDTFHAVQQQLAANKGKGGETGKAQNLLKHLPKCAYCGGPMVFIHSGGKKAGYPYLICDNARRGIRCERYRIRYDETETTILENCKGLRPEQVLPDPGQQASVCAGLRKRLQGIEGELADLEEHANNLLDQIERTAKGPTRDRLTARLQQLDAKKPTLEAERKDIEQELAKSEQTLKSFESWQRGLKDLQRALARTPDDVELRIRVNLHLRELIAKIEVFAVGFLKRGSPDTTNRQRPRRRGEASSAPGPRKLLDVECLADEIENEFGPVPDAFLRYVTARRMSKEGRFLRLHFKTGEVRDIVPPGSIASGKGLEVEEGIVGWRSAGPNVDKLRQEFEAQKPHQRKSARLITT